MAGTIPLSMTQQFDVYGKPLSGGQLYIMVAGTVSAPQDAFQDINLSIKMPYPMTLDAAGRIPQFFLADGSVKVRLQDASGVVQLAADSVLVIGPSGGSGGGGAVVDPTQLIKTGQMILMYGVGPLTGYVRMNGLSIGSSTSGATERANPDCQNCYLYLWGADPNLAVGGGRGGTATNDWTANKPLFLPDWRGYNVGALDDMGNVAAGRLTGFPNPTTLGSAGGLPTNTLGVGNLPPYTPSGSVNSQLAAQNKFVQQSNVGNTALSSLASGTAGFGFTSVPAVVDASTLAGVSSAFHGDAQGGASAPFNNISPRKLCTLYIKL